MWYVPHEPLHNRVAAMRARGALVAAHDLFGGLLQDALHLGLARLHRLLRGPLQPADKPGFSAECKAQTSLGSR